jgi:hypothetical protein
MSDSSQDMYGIRGWPYGYNNISDAHDTDTVIHITPLIDIDDINEINANHVHRINNTSDNGMLHTHNHNFNVVSYRLCCSNQ